MMVRVLILLVLFGSSTLALAQSDMLSEEVTKNYRDGYYDYDLVRMTNRANPKISLDLVQTENQLRGSVMFNWHRENMEMRLRWVEQQDWTKEYKAMFARAVQWRRETFNGGPEKLYQLSHKYLHVPNAEKYGYVELSTQLLGHAATAGHEKAIKEMLDHHPKRISSWTLNRTRKVYYRDAVSGGVSATLSLAAVYLYGPVFDDDRTKGFYWYLRLPKSRLTKKLIDTIHENNGRVSPEERNQAQSWIRSGHVPPM